MREHWPKIIDVVTIIWLGIFALTFFVPPELEATLDLVLLALLSLFVVDLIILYRESKGMRDFLLNNWLDILMLVPYVRIFRILRVVRVLRIARLSTITRLGRIERTIRGLFRAKKGRRKAPP